MRSLRSPNKLFIYYLRTQKTEIRTIFSFSLCAVLLQVALVTYFRRVLGELRELRLLEDSEMCYCQYQKLVLVLVNSQDKAVIV